MATYKLIQDIEAEDHILGPLTFRQFIFGLIAAFLAYLCFISVAKHVSFLLVLFAPPMLFCGFFAFPWGRDQPTELWALAKLRFWFKPRKRIWNQSGVKELVTITVPKKVERVLTDNLSQTEVKSRLQALANTLDSRGWAIKHIDAIGYVPQTSSSNPDRLIDIPEVPQEVPNDTAAPDMMDTETSPIAQQFQNMIDKSSHDYKQRLMDQLRQPLPAAGQLDSQASQQWFMNHNPVAAGPVPGATAVPVAPAAMPMNVPATVPVPDGNSTTSVMPQTPSIMAAGPAAASDDTALSSQLLKGRAAHKEAYSNMRTLKPGGPQPPAMAPAVATPATPVTPEGYPAILSLSKNNDLNVATIAREAHRAKDKDGSQDEVVVSLH